MIKQTISDGIYIYHCTTNDIEIEFQIINYNNDIILNTATTFGNTTADSQMLILKFHENLTINSGIILIPQVRKKGMVIYVAGTLINNGKISMTARGASAVGQDVYLYNDEYVPAIGGNGGKGIKGQVNGSVGINGTNRSTGGGGAGSSMRANTTGGNGGSGTSYSGGTGGGGASSALDTGMVGYSGSNTGGAGGVALGRRTSSTMYTAGGGVGNPSGKDAIPTSGANVTVTGNATSNSPSGTGGLLVIFTSIFENNGVIESNGTGSIYPKGYNNGVTCSGGSSGGGSINIFLSNCISEGTLTATGGKSTVVSGCTGGNGGNGSITLTELINPISQMIKTKVYDEIIKTFLNKNIINFSIESDSENDDSGSNSLPDSEETSSNFVTSSDEIILTNDNYIFTAKEDNQEQEESTSESTTMKTLLKTVMAEALNDNGYYNK